jgi:hypothetical protein
VLLDSQVHAGYALEVPEGWEAVERPGADVELVISSPALAGRATVLNVERFVRDEYTPPDAVDRLLTGRVEQLLATMVDALLIDMLVVPEPRGATEPGMLATVAYRHGPMTVTCFVWVFESDAGALLLTGIVDADLLDTDGPVLAGIVASLDLAVDTIGEQPPLEPIVVDGAAPTDLPSLPDGWADADSGADQPPRRFMIRDADAGTLPVTVASGFGPPADPGANPADVHARACEELALTLTDATLLDRGAATLAGAPALRTSIWFRHGAGNRIADLWTAGPVVAWSVAQVDDDAGRAAAEALVAGATLAQLGCDGSPPEHGAPGVAAEASAPGVLESADDVHVAQRAEHEADGRYDGVSVALRIELADRVVTALGVIEGDTVAFAVEGDPLGDDGPLYRPVAGLPIELASLVALAPSPVPADDAVVLATDDPEVASGRAALLAGWPAELLEGTPLAAGDGLVLWSVLASWNAPGGETGARAIVVADGGEHGLATVEASSDGDIAVVPCTSTDVWAQLCELLPRPFELA